MDLTDPGVVAVVIECAQLEMPSLTATCFVAGYCSATGTPFSIKHIFGCARAEVNLL